MFEGSDLAVLLSAKADDAILFVRWDRMRNMVQEVRISDLFRIDLPHCGSAVLKLLAGKDWRALVLFHCVTHTEFNAFAGVGEVTAAKVVECTWIDHRLGDSDGSHSDAAYASVEEAPGTLVGYAWRAHSEWVFTRGIELQTISAVSSCICRAHAIRLCSLAFDPYAKMERPLSGNMLSPVEASLVGTPLAEDQAIECAYGMLRHSWTVGGLQSVNRPDGSLRLVEAARVPEFFGVIRRGECVHFTYGMLDVSLGVKALCETPPAEVEWGNEDALIGDLTQDRHPQSLST
mmetsp:Transcript_2933/g.8510  ORF Transcript_2933/g.8510 Transcript_2933/m.8510 type:complete len:290 (+) Transcript_2933:554-1423(+)